jgi:hypothetical protein
VGRGDRLRLSAELLTLAGHAVVFCRNIPEAMRVASDLSRIGVPAASVEDRDFSSSRVRAQVVTDETVLNCERGSTSLVIQFDPAGTARRHRRRIDLVAHPAGATVVSFVVPEREDDVRRLLGALDLPDVLTGPDLAAARDAMAEQRLAADTPAADDHRGDHVDPGANARDGAGDHDSALRAAGRAVRNTSHHAARVGHAVGQRVRTVARRGRRPAPDGADHTADHTVDHATDTHG